MDDEFSPPDTIMVKFNNPSLYEAIERCANFIGCKIWEVENHPDPIAVGHFIAIYDRKFLQEQAWKEYVDFQRYLHEERLIATCCPKDLVILIGVNADLPKVPGVRIYRCDPEDKERIISLIEAEHDRYKSN